MGENKTKRGSLTVRTSSPQQRLSPVVSLAGSVWVQLPATRMSFGKAFYPPGSKSRRGSATVGD